MSKGDDECRMLMPNGTQEFGAIGLGLSLAARFRLASSTTASGMAAVCGEPVGNCFKNLEIALAGPGGLARMRAPKAQLPSCCW